MTRFLCIAASCALLSLAGGCATLRLKHQIEPLYVTVDVNIKIQKELDEFFDFEDSFARSMQKGDLHE